MTFISFEKCSHPARVLADLNARHPRDVSNQVFFRARCEEKIKILISTVIFEANLSYVCIFYYKHVIKFNWRNGTLANEYLTYFTSLVHLVAGIVHIWPRFRGADPRSRLGQGGKKCKKNQQLHDQCNETLTQTRR